MPSLFSRLTVDVAIHSTVLTNSTPAIQNAPHETRLPPERVAFRVAVRNAPGAMGWFLRNAAHLVFAAGIAALVYGLEVEGGLGVLLEVVAGAAVALVLAVWLYTALVLTNGPAREQLRYHTESGTIAPTHAQLDHLRVLAAWNHDGGGWSQTLEFHPRDARLSPRQRSRYHYLHLAPTSDFVEQLDADWNVLTGGEALALVDQVMSEGMHSRPYAVSSALRGVDLAERLATLTDLPITTVLDSVAPSSLRPAAYLWGYDLQRTAALTSIAYMAGLLDESAAWDALERCADAIYAMFPAEEDYLINCRIGHAFWANSAGAAMERKRAYDAYLSSDWPMRRREWPTVPASRMSERMRSGFSREIAEARSSAGPEGDCFP
jgi:hypothetical protein